MKIRALTRAEIPYIWQINRSEVIRGVYHIKKGKLVRKAEYYDMHGWPPGEPEHFTPFLMDCFDHGGHFWGAFKGDLLIAAVVLENRFIGSSKDTLQLKFLHVSNHCREQGLGKKLFLLAAEKALELGARKLYISSTPSENTVNFYLRLGCELAVEIDAELYNLEPDDIHLEFSIKALES